MKTDKNGLSQCPNGAERYESFKTRGKVYYQYDYRAESGELFSCVKPSLQQCRNARDEYFQK
jgi:hypothetical protein